jgi:hypothetical protein
MRYRMPAFTRMFMVAAVALVGMIVSGGPAPVAHATIFGCRSDPVVVLSDGTILDVTADIDTLVSNVREIHYTVHGPPNVQLVAAISTPTLGFAGKETFTYYADAEPYQYMTETLVHTYPDPVRVTAHTTFAKVELVHYTSVEFEYQPISGFNGQVLRAVLMR